jgi:hypothetical protein
LVNNMGILAEFNWKSWLPVQSVPITTNVVSSKRQVGGFLRAGLDINVCSIPVKTDVGQVDLVLRLSDGISEKIRDSQTCRYEGQIYFHWYKILGLLYKRALFDLQFVHNLFWLKLFKVKRQIKILLLYHLSFLHALMKFKDIDKIKVAISETL